jgi:hypothetical protein
MRGSSRAVTAVVLALTMAIGVGATVVARPAGEGRLEAALVRTDPGGSDTDRGSFRG